MFVGPNLGVNCLQRLSEDDTSRQRVKLKSANLDFSRHFMQLLSFLQLKIRLDIHVNHLLADHLHVISNIISHP